MNDSLTNAFGSGISVWVDERIGGLRWVLISDVIREASSLRHSTPDETFLGYRGLSMGISLPCVCAYVSICAKGVWNGVWARWL